MRQTRKNQAQEPGEALFRGLRLRLTLWYCGVLGAALVLFGITLYFGTQYFLLHPIQSDIQNLAHAQAHQWSTSPANAPVAYACSLPNHNPPGQSGLPVQNQGQNMEFATLQFVACFDQNGSLQANQSTNELPPALLTNTVVLAALKSSTGDTADTVNVGGQLGSVYRYALVVSNAGGSGNIGVVVVGESIQAQESALSLLLTLLLIVGSGALLGSGFGGLFLARRALIPARIAWANQQRFIADASHELRTPLTLLRADAEVLLRGKRRLELEDAELLEHIIAETNHMTNLTINLLTLARLDNQVTHREHEVVSLTKLLPQVVQRVQALAGQQNIAVQEEHVANLYVIGDSTLLEQAVLILLDNAIKYNRNGGSINIRATAQDEYMLLEVRDSGIGIAAEDLLYLGQRFYRVDKARSRAAGGTGLGLSIAQGIAILHGGQLTLTSIPEQGTVATLKLPLVHETLHIEA